MVKGVRRDICHFCAGLTPEAYGTARARGVSGGSVSRHYKIGMRREAIGKPCGGSMFKGSKFNGCRRFKVQCSKVQGLKIKDCSNCSSPSIRPLGLLRTDGVFQLRSDRSTDNHNRDPVPISSKTFKTFQPVQTFRDGSQPLSRIMQRWQISRPSPFTKSARLKTDSGQ
jgi:hypothetical protein